MTATVTDARPPLLLIRLMNPIMRTVLRTPLGRVVRPFALLEFEGRRSGRHFRVPVGLHAIGDRVIVFTPAPWRANFAGGLAADVRFRGRVRSMVGTLVTDPTAVANTLNELFESGTSPRNVGLVVEGGAVSAADVVSVDRAMIELTAA